MSATGSRLTVRERRSPERTAATTSAVWLLGRNARGRCVRRRDGPSPLSPLWQHVDRGVPVLPALWAPERRIRARGRAPPAPEAAAADAVAGGRRLRRPLAGVSRAGGEAT